MSQFSKIDLNGTKGILLDFDNALYKYDPCHQHALDSVYFEIKKHLDVESFEQFLDFYKKAQKKVKANIPDRAASHSRLLYFQILFEDYFGHVKVGLNLQFEKLYWNSFFEKMVLADDVLDFLEKCKKESIRICVVTDLTAQIQFKKFLHLGLEKYFDFVVSSEEAGMEKPGEGIFLLALQKLGMSKDDVLVIGDSKKRDIAGAENLGIRSHLIEL